MRALAAASAVLVIMAVLLAQRPTPERATRVVPGEAALRLEPPRAAHQAAPLPGAPITSAGADVATASVHQAAPKHTTAENAAAVEARRAATTTTQPGAAPRVERFRRGSREHAAAVGKALASPDYEHAAAPVARLYLAYFGRVPDYEGFGHYIGEREVGVPLEDIAQEFAGSPEFGMRYGELDNAAFVDRIHRNVGAAEAAQRDYWIAQLESGAMSRGEVMLAFSESGHFRSSTSDAVFIAMAYAQALGRAPTPAERAHWEAFLAAGHPHGAVLEALVGGRAGK